MKKKRIKIAAAITVILTLITLLFMQLFRKTLFTVTSEFSHPFLSVISKDDNSSIREALTKKTKDELINELIHLRKKDEEKNLELQILYSEKNDKQILERHLKIKPTPGYQCISAKIFLRDPAFWYENFSINKGWSSGIESGAIVLTEINDPNGNNSSLAVVGRIEKVSEYESVVETIISRHCKLSVLLEQSGATGILNGDTLRNGKPSLKVTYLPTFKTYSPGELVKTSGLCSVKDRSTSDSLYPTPPGLLVGKVAGTDSPEVRVVRQLNAEAKVIPAVNFDSLKYVTVLIRKDHRIIRSF